MATMTLDVRIPARCWIAPEMPTATYNVGLTVLPVCPTWSAWGRHPASTTAREAPTAARPANAAASSSNTLKLAGSLSPRPPDTTIGASATSSMPASAALISFTTTRPAGPATRDARGDGARVALRRIHAERGVRERDHLVRAEPAQLVRAARRARRQNQRVHVATQRVGEPPGAGHHLVRHLPQRAVPLLE